MALQDYCWYVTLHDLSIQKLQTVEPRRVIIIETTACILKEITIDLESKREVVLSPWPVSLPTHTTPAYNSPLGTGMVSKEVGIGWTEQLQDVVGVEDRTCVYFFAPSRM